MTRHDLAERGIDTRLIAVILAPRSRDLKAVSVTRYTAGVRSRYASVKDAAPIMRVDMPLKTREHFVMGI